MAHSASTAPMARAHVQMHSPKLPGDIAAPGLPMEPNRTEPTVWTESPAGGPRREFVVGSLQGQWTEVWFHKKLLLKQSVQSHKNV